jgi:hypothetical protein
MCLKNQYSKELSMLKPKFSSAVHVIELYEKKCQIYTKKKIDLGNFLLILCQKPFSASGTPNLKHPSSFIAQMPGSVSTHHAKHIT